MQTRKSESLTDNIEGIRRDLEELKTNQFTGQSSGLKFYDYIAQPIVLTYDPSVAPSVNVMEYLIEAKFEGSIENPLAFFTASTDQGWQADFYFQSNDHFAVSTDNKTIMSYSFQEMYSQDAPVTLQVSVVSNDPNGKLTVTTRGQRAY